MAGPVQVKEQRRQLTAKPVRWIMRNAKGNKATRGQPSPNTPRPDARPPARSLPMTANWTGNPRFSRPVPPASGAATAHPCAYRPKSSRRCVRTVR